MLMSVCIGADFRAVLDLVEPRPLTIYWSVALDDGSVRQRPESPTEADLRKLLSALNRAVRIVEAAHAEQGAQEQVDSGQISKC